MQQINPITNYSIVRQLDNVNDPVTYYVRAVIKYSSNGVVYKTVELTDKGNQRFVGEYTSPAASQMGTQIDITTYVYEDSNYSVLSQVYSTTNTQFLVLTQFSPSFGTGGGSGGVSIAEIEALLEKRKPLPPITLEDVLKAVERVFGEKFGVIDSYLGYLSDGFEKIHGKVRKLTHKKDRSDEILSIFGTKISELHNGLKNHSSEISEKYIKEIENTKENIILSLTDIISENHKGYELTLQDLKNEMPTHIKSNFDEIVRNENKLRRKGIDDYVKKMRNGLDEIIGNNFVSEIPEEKIDYNEKAKKFLS